MLIRPLSWGDPSVTEPDGDFLLPAGTVTLLLADIEGSTRLFEQGDEGGTVAIERLNELVGELIGRHGGVRPVEQGEGDSFVAAFSRPSDAVACALSLQLGLKVEPIALRIGLHTGEVQLRGDGNYVGTTVNRAARLRDVAHGGQTVLSQPTRDLVIERLPHGVSLEDLGVHRLRDLARPEHLWQLRHPELREIFPPLRSIDSLPHNLPVQLTSFVGRKKELGEVTALLEDNRMVTLNGSGGCGKTRLALQLAAELLETRPGGAWFTDLASVTDQPLALQAVAGALGVQLMEGGDLLSGVVATLGDASSLLILDNCEHLVSTSAELADKLLRACPELNVLATSREPLGVPGEVIYRVPSLAVPPRDEAPRIEGLGRFAAIELFVDRARRNDSSFDLTEENAPAVTGICQRLEGIPLAIELAAARIRVLTPDQILTGLNDRFQLLTGGARTAVPRQQTLQASVDWSYDLLSEPERVLLRRLSIFAGGFTLETAREVGGVDPIAPHHVLDLLSLLVDKSLVLREEGRFRLLETIRQYAALRMRDTGEDELISRRHRDVFLALAASLSPELRGARQDDAIHRLNEELDNLRAALLWSRRTGEKDALLRLASSLTRFWISTGLVGEGRAWLSGVEEDAQGVDQGVRTEALVAAAALASEAMMAVRYGEAALAHYEKQGDVRGMARAIASFAPAKTRQSRDLELIDRGIGLSKEVGDTGSLIELLHTRAWALSARLGDQRSALVAADEALSAAQSAGGPREARSIRELRGLVLNNAGRFRQAQEELEPLIIESRDAGDAVNLRGSLAYLATALYWMGNHEAAQPAMEALETARRLGAPEEYEAYPLRILGLIRVSEGDFEEGIRLLRQSQSTASGAGDKAFGGVWLVRAELHRGKVVEARAALKEALALLSSETRFVPPPSTVAAIRLAEAELARAEGDLATAEDLAHQALGAVGKLQRLFVLGLMAAVAADLESFDEAGRIAGAADRMSEGMGVKWPPVWRGPFDSAVTAARATLGDERFKEVWEEGRGMTEEEAIAYARRGRGERKRPSSGWPSLTPAELSVVRLVAEGLTNTDIAGRLFISRRTVQTHLTRTFAKLGLKTRSELAAQAVRRGLDATKS